MKTLLLVAILLLGVQHSSSALDSENGLSERFKVEYVEAEKTQKLSELPIFYNQRDTAIRDEQAAIQKGATPEKIDRTRRIHFRNAFYPIRVTDQITGLIYEVQSDRRTVIAKKPNGEIIWRVNPFQDARMEPYRFKYPYITHFAKIDTKAIKGPVLLIGFNSSQYGPIELATGKFHFWGQD